MASSIVSWLISDNFYIIYRFVLVSAHSFVSYSSLAIAIDLGVDQNEALLFQLWFAGFYRRSEVLNVWTGRVVSATRWWMTGSTWHCPLVYWETIVYCLKLFVVISWCCCVGWCRPAAGSGSKGSICYNANRLLF